MDPKVVRLLFVLGVFLFGLLAGFLIGAAYQATNPFIRRVNSLDGGLD